MKKILIIINPKAGKKEGSRNLADIIDVFCRKGYRVAVETTAARGDGTEIAKREAGNFDILVAIGGDGTFNEVVEGVLLSGKDVPIGYIPAGSTNDFGASLGIPSDMVKAAENITEENPRVIDIGSFNGRYFSYVASFGAFTRASYEAPQSIKNALGHLAYILEGIKDIPSIRAEKLTFRTADKEYSGKYLFGAVSNSTSIGGILTLPEDEVDMGDGEFEVLLVKAPSNLIELNQIMLAVTTRDFGSPHLEFFSASELNVEADPEMPWTLDGEYQAGSAEIQIENVHNAAKILL